MLTAVTETGAGSSGQSTMAAGAVDDLDPVRRVATTRAARRPRAPGARRPARRPACWRDHLTPRASRRRPRSTATSRPRGASRSVRRYSVSPSEPTTWWASVSSATTDDLGRRRSGTRPLVPDQPAGVHGAARIGARAAGQHQPATVGGHPRLGHPVAGRAATRPARRRPGRSPSRCSTSSPAPIAAVNSPPSGRRVAPVEESRLVRQPGRGRSTWSRSARPAGRRRCRPRGPGSSASRTRPRTARRPGSVPSGLTRAAVIATVPSADSTFGSSSRVGASSSSSRRAGGEQLVLVQLAGIGDDEVPAAALPRHPAPRRGEQRGGQLQQRRPGRQRGEIRCRTGRSARRRRPGCGPRPGPRGTGRDRRRSTPCSTSTTSSRTVGGYDRSWLLTGPISPRVRVPVSPPTPAARTARSSADPPPAVSPGGSRTAWRARPSSGWTARRWPGSGRAAPPAPTATRPAP